MNAPLAVLVTWALLLAACQAPAADAGGSPEVEGAPLRVAAASDLRFAMDELVDDWVELDPASPIDVVYGSSGSFLAQISQGAPFDVFFSGDVEYPRELERAGLAEAGSTRVYGTGRIVAWVPAASAIDVEGRGLAALADPSVGTVAIANPDHAPYGRAAMAAMRRAGVLEAVQPKLVLGENVSQAAQFVETGAADAGIIALSLALAPPLVDRGRYAIVPPDSYPRLEQGAVVPSAAARPEAARAFLDFVLGPAGRAVLERYGFLPPEA